MAPLDARKSGSFKINSDIEIHRLGFGAMRITGPRVWGPPLDIAEATRTLKRLPELGIDFIDTADSYGPYVSEQLIRETLYPYDGILVATKAGLRRPGLTSKIHALVDALGNPVDLMLTPGQAHDLACAEPLDTDAPIRPLTPRFNPISAILAAFHRFGLLANTRWSTCGGQRVATSPEH